MSDDLQRKIKKVVIDNDDKDMKEIPGELPVIFTQRSPLFHEYYIYPFKQEYKTKMKISFQDVDLSEIIKSFIGGYYAKKRV